MVVHPDQDTNDVSRLTIIIPLLDDTPVEAFEETLASVLVHKPVDTEILVVNGTEYADPWNTANDGVEFLAFHPLANPVEILNEAIRRATGKILHILWPGTEVTPNWTASAMELFGDEAVGIVVPSVFDRRKPKRVFSFGIHYKSEGVLRTIRRSQWDEVSGKTIVPHISAVFFRAEAFVNAPLFDRIFIPQIAYVDLAMNLTARGWKTTVDQNCRIMVRPNHLPTTNPFVWGMQTERLYFRWFGENGAFWTLGSHFGSFLVDFWRHFPMLKSYKILAGRLFGLLYFGEMLPIVRRFHKDRSRVESFTSTPILTPISCGDQNNRDSASAKKSA